MGHPIQIILIRQLAEYLSVPLLLFDPQGNLIFFNEAAEAILGRRFEESGGMTRQEWLALHGREDDEGRPLPDEDMPLMVTLAERRPTHRRFHLCGSDGIERHIEASAIPISGLQGDFLGVATLFWELPG